MLNNLRIGYTSFSADHRHPSDGRRFAYFASIYGLPFEEAKPGRDYDLVVVTQAADISAWSRLKRGGPRLIYDLPDSHLSAGLWNSPREAFRGIGKFVVGHHSSLVLDFRKAMVEMCARADAVVCCTPEQAATIIPYNSTVSPILDFSTVAVRQKKMAYAAGKPFRLFWEGHGSNAITLAVIAEPLRELARTREIEVHLVTNLDYAARLRNYGRKSAVRDVRRALHGVATYFHEWNLGMIGTVAAACDVAVIPLPSSNKLYLNKPENRLLLMWRLGLPTIVSATPAHVRTMLAAGQDYYCATDAEWKEKLITLIENETLRRQAGEGGRRWVETNWTDAELVRRWENVVLHATGSSHARS